MPRYIDADKMYKDLTSMYDSFVDFGELAEYLDKHFSIDATLSSDIREVKCGHWKDGKVFATCSVCGANRDNYDEYWDYCPNCGAEMDEEEKE